MEIKAVKFRTDGFYTQPFVMGGEDGQEKYDPNIRYRGSLYVRSADMSTIRYGFQEEKYDADIEAGYAEYRCCLS